MGRVSTKEKYGLTDEALLDMWELHKSTKKISKKLGCSDQTTRKLLKEAGLDYSETRIPRDRKNKGAFAQWLRDNPSVSLPRDFKAISELSNCSLSMVRTYFYREQDRYYRKWETYLPFWIKSKEGFGPEDKIPPSSIQSVSFTVDRYSFNCKVKMTLKEGGRLEYTLSKHLLDTKVGDLI
jgi:hypothetical protein